MVGTNPVGSGGDALGPAAGPTARCGRAAMGSDRLQPNPLRLYLRCGVHSGPAQPSRQPCTTIRTRGVFAPRARRSAAITASMEPPSIRIRSFSPPVPARPTASSSGCSAIPGDEVLIGQPGYPLFDFLARLDDVRLVPYELFYDHGWHLDLEALRSRVTPRTRAIAVVHPNNPTGHFTRPGERAGASKSCAANTAWR